MDRTQHFFMAWLVVSTVFVSASATEAVSSVGTEGIAVPLGSGVVKSCPTGGGTERRLPHRGNNLWWVQYGARDLPQEDKGSEPQPAAQESPRVSIPESVIAEEDIEFANPDNQHLKLDLYRPREGGPFPAVVCIHGGGFVGGRREVLRWTCVRLATEGYAAVTVQYRLAPKYPFPACVHDVKEAVRWLRANAQKYHIDPERIAAMGTSAGGHLATFLAVTGDVKEFEGDGGHADQSSRVVCAVNVSGPTDFTRIQGKSKAEPLLVPFLGGTIDTHRREHIRASPLYWVTPNAAPVLTVIGTKDDQVPVEQAQWLHERLTAAGVQSELVVIEGAGHTLSGADRQKAQATMLAFLKKHLQPEGPPSAKGEQKPVQQNAKPNPPLVLILPTYRNCQALIKLWNDGIGKPSDLVVCIPAPEDMKDPSRIERTLAGVNAGEHGWVTASFAMVENGEAKMPKSVKWFFYDHEPWEHTPKQEKEDVVAVSKAIRQFCDRQGLKAGITPVYARWEDNFNLEHVKKVARYYDAYILQCQDFQRDPARRERIVKLLREITEAIHSVNPNCLVGCQLGAADRHGGPQAALALYEATKDFVQIYTAWWEPDEQNMIELLKALRLRR